MKMRLSDLVPHTSTWLGVPEAQVKTVARVLQPAALISSAGKNPRGVEMTTEDKINLFLGVCGVEIANRAAEHVRVWRRLIRTSLPADPKFAFQRATNVQDFFVDLITKDLNGGALSVWLKEADDASIAEMKSRGGPSHLVGKDHAVTLDFYVDEFSLTLIVSRYAGKQQSTADIMKVSFGQAPPGEEHEYKIPPQDQSYRARSHLIRRLTEENLRGWGTCLND